MATETHNQFTDRGKEIWRVDRLIELARELPVEWVALSEITEIDSVYWFDEAHPPTCRAVIDHARRIEQADLQHPVILSATGLVMDGMHRVAKAIALGQDRIEAVRFERDPEPDRIEPRQG